MKKMMLLLSATVYFLAMHSMAWADYQYTTLDYPGGIGTGLMAMGGETLVGAYLPGNNASLPCDQEVGQALKYSGGVWTPLLFPGSVRSCAQDISGGTIVGGWEGTTCNDHGFLFDGTTWTSLDYPGATDTWASGIHEGSVVGFYSSDTVPGDHGFLYSGGTWTTIAYPGAACTYANGIEGNNIVGEYIDSSDVSHGFLYTGSTWTTLDYPGAKGTKLNGIKGDLITGWYYDNHEKAHGFIYKNGTWTPFDFPGATNTYPSRIDTSNNLVGYYQDASGLHGFLATPSGATPSLALTPSGPGAGTITSSPTGITCGSTCSASFDSGTQLSLTPTPASGSYFAGWSGNGCSGNGTVTPLLILSSPL